MPDAKICPVPACDRPIRTADLMCHRHWYVVPDELRVAYRAALAAFKASRSARDAPALLAAQKAAIESVNPRGSR